MALQARQNLYAFAVGAAAGSTVGLVGWGGGQIIIPAMTLPFPVANLSQLSATGISLTSLSVSTISSGYQYWKDERVNAQLALAIAIPSVLSARIGSHFAKKLSGDVLALIFNGLSIVLIPMHLWVQQRASSRKVVRKEPSVVPHRADGGNFVISKNSFADTGASSLIPASPLQRCLSTKLNNSPSTPSDGSLSQHMAFGLVSGIISSLMGVGGLPLTMSYITEAMNLPHHYVQGTAICATIPSLLTSAVSRLNAIPLRTSGFVVVGAMFGGYCGAKAALYLSEEQLRIFYMGSLVVFGGRSIVGAGRNIRSIYGRKY